MSAGNEYIYVYIYIYICVTYSDDTHEFLNIHKRYLVTLARPRNQCPSSPSFQFVVSKDKDAYLFSPPSPNSLRANRDRTCISRIANIRRRGKSIGNYRERERERKREATKGRERERETGISRRKMGSAVSIGSGGNSRLKSQR